VRGRQYERIAGSLTTFKEAFRRGVDERHRGNSDLAAVILQRAESLALDDACRVALGAAYRDLQMLDKAEALYRGVLSRGPSRAAQVGLAAVLRDMGSRSETEALCRAVLARYPHDQYARAMLAAIQADARRR
jgi:tetratricopeptide (TPR) repeat protein